MKTQHNTAVIYLSQTAGNDHYSGYAPVADEYGNGPVATWERVLEMISTQRAAHNGQPLSVQLLEDYYTTATVCIGPAFFNATMVGGGSVSDVTLESAPGVRAGVYGGRRLSGFHEAVFRGAPCLARSLADLPSEEKQFGELYVNHRRAALPRFPREGELKARDTENNLPWQLENGSRYITVDPADLAGIADVTACTVNFDHYWVDEHTPIASYDAATGRMEFMYASRFNLTTAYDGKLASDVYYYLENVPELFDTPGQYYYDRNADIVYYLPREGETAETVTAVIPTVEQVFHIAGTPEAAAEGIRFRRLCIGCTDSRLAPCGSYQLAADEQAAVKSTGTVLWEHAIGGEMTDCTVCLTGGYGIRFGLDCHAMRVENCTLSDLGAGGVAIFGGSTAEEPTTNGITVRHNRMIRGGQRLAAGCGILLAHASECELADNEISYFAYTGISSGWQWGYKFSTTHHIRITGNHIHHIGNGRLSDMGGIYLLGPQRGTVVSGNRIHDVVCRRYGAWGIYTDEGSSYITIENNVVYRTAGNAFHQHFGSYNTVRNNVFAFAGQGLIRMSRREAHPAVLFEHNVLITNGEPVYDGGEYGNISLYPNLGMTASGNVLWDIAGEPVLFRLPDGQGLSLADWQEHFGTDEDSVVENPGTFTAEDGYLHPSASLAAHGFFAEQLPQ